MSGTFQISHQHGILANQDHTRDFQHRLPLPPTIPLMFTGRPGHLPKVEPNICSPIKVDIFIVDS